MFTKKKDDHLNEYEIQKINEIFNSFHLYTNEKVVYRISYNEPIHVCSYLKIGKFKHVELFASIEACGINDYSDFFYYNSPGRHDGKKIKKDSYRNLPNPLELEKDDYPIKIMKLSSYTFLENSKNGKPKLYEDRFLIRYKYKSYQGFFGTSYDKTFWKERLEKEFDDIKLYFIKNTLSELKKFKNKNKFTDIEAQAKALRKKFY